MVLPVGQVAGSGVKPAVGVQDDDKCHYFRWRIRTSMCSRWHWSILTAFAAMCLSRALIRWWVTCSSQGQFRLIEALLLLMANNAVQASFRVLGVA